MSINDRVREVRSSLKLTQKEFGQRLAIAQSYLTNIETGKREVTEKIQKLICLQFGVNEEWLRTGNGEMFAENDDVLLSQLAKQYNLDDFSRKFMEVFLALPEEQRKTVLSYANFLSSNVANSEFSEEVAPTRAVGDELSDTELDREVQSYRRELEVEKRAAEKSPASDGIKEA